MDQLQSHGRERRNRKSISDIMDGPRHMSPLRLNLAPENPLEGVLYGHNRDFKRSIIKINRRKLPVDFFSNELPDAPARRTLERRPFLSTDRKNDLPLTDRKPYKEDQHIQNPDSKGTLEIEYPLKATSSFGGNHIIHARQPHHELIRFRSNETRSEQKRDKPIEQRKLTAAAQSTKPDVLDLYTIPKEEADGAVVLGIKEFRERELPSRSIALRDTKKDRKVERVIDLDNLKFDVSKMRMHAQRKQQEGLRDGKDGETKEINSPLRKQIVSPKKEVISPVKIIVTNPDPRKVDNSPMSHSVNNPANQFFDVTFYNTKSSVLPPISK